ncbi:MAG: DsbC family protein, partial [Gammaproteobacteria bacterium]|nr:DsbC family protein [Gammaproteobacteria bacterium]
LIVVLLGLGSSVQGAGVPDVIASQLQKSFPEVRSEQISPSPIPGLYELRVGPQIAYVSADGRYLVRGDIIDVMSDTNVSEERRAGARLAAIDDIGEARMIIFTPRQVKHTISVFTDVDCGYCRKLHREIGEYMARGIRVRYLFFPRSGPNTESWAKAEKVWCSADRADALTRSKRGEMLATKACSPTPVQDHYSLGLSFGVTGTPAIITDTGELVPGYVPAAELGAYLDGNKGS